MKYILLILCVLGLSDLSLAELAAPDTVDPTTDTAEGQSSTGAASANDFSREVKCAQVLTASPLQNVSDNNRVYAVGDGSFVFAATCEGGRGFLRVGNRGAVCFALIHDREPNLLRPTTEHHFRLPALPKEPGRATPGPIKLMVDADNQDHNNTTFDTTNVSSENSSVIKGGVDANDFKTQNAMVGKMREMLKDALTNSTKAKIAKEKNALALGQLVCACQDVTDLKPQTDALEAAYSKLSTKALPCGPLVSQLRSQTPRSYALEN